MSAWCLAARSRTDGARPDASRCRSCPMRVHRRGSHPRVSCKHNYTAYAQQQAQINQQLIFAATTRKHLILCSEHSTTVIAHHTWEAASSLFASWVRAEERPADLLDSRGPLVAAAQTTHVRMTKIQRVDRQVVMTSTNQNCKPEQQIVTPFNNSKSPII